MQRMNVSALALLAAVTAGTVSAQSIVNTAGERLSADHAPMGIKAGSFLIIPKADLDVTHSDNIYATTNNTESDMITTLRPEVKVKSNWNRHALNAMARQETVRYNDNRSENHNNLTLAADGRVDIMRDTSIGGGVSFARDHEDRGNPNSLASNSKPVEYTTSIARLGLYRGLGRASARFDTEAKKLDYKDGYTSAGAFVDNGQRDRDEYTNSLRLGWQFDPRFEGFVKGTMDTRNYKRDFSTGYVNRGNNGSSLVAGTTFDVSGKTKGEVFAGVVERNYNNPTFKDISEPTWGGKVTWNFSELTSVIAGVDRTIEETTIGASSGYVSTAYTAKVEHALTRDVLLSGNVGWTENEYKGTAANQRQDDVFSVGAGADYYLGKNFKAGVGYTYQDRDSNVTGGDFDRNMLMLRLTATY